MLLQPFLENAIHHGLRGKLTDGRIDITIKEEGISILRVEIQDNGLGLSASADIPKTGHRSTALQVIRERLSLLEGTANEAPYQIQEMVENDEVKGVLVVVRVPVLV